MSSEHCEVGQIERPGTIESRRDCDGLLPLCKPSASPGVSSVAEALLGIASCSGGQTLCIIEWQCGQVLELSSSDSVLWVLAGTDRVYTCTYINKYMYMISK